MADNALLELLNNKEIAQIIAARFKHSRKVMGLTQSELSKKAGVGVNTVSRLENKGQATLENIIKISKALKDLSFLNHIFNHPVYDDVADLVENLRFRN